MQKNTKKALLASVLSLLLCVSMLVGTTFAWFTDSVTTGVNTIQSGTLDVDLVDADGVTLEGKSLEFIDKDDNDLWEPGCKYELETFKIVNKGNLALKYKVVLSDATGDVKLLEAIEWTVTVNGQPYDSLEAFAAALQDLPLLPNTDSGDITIIGHMKEEAGNEYQGLTVDGIAITVYATQYTKESDSFNDQYDAAATYLNEDENGNYVIASAGDLLYFAQQVNSGNGYRGETIVLANDINLKGAKWTPIGNAAHGFNGTFDGQNHTISNYSVEGTINVGLFGYALNGGNIKNLKVKNVTVKGDDYAGAILGRGYTDIVNCHAEDCTITVTPYLMADGVTYDGGAKAGAVIGQLLEGASNTVVGCSAKNVTIIGYRDLGGVLGMAHNNNYVSGCSAENVSITYVSASPYNDNDPNQNAGAIVGRIQASATVDFTADENANFKLIKSVNNADALAAALAEGGEVVLADDITVDVADIAFTVAKGTSAKLDLNGHDIISTSTTVANVQLFKVNGNLEIVGEGTISLTNNKLIWDTGYRYTPINIRETGVVTLGEGVKVICETGSETSDGYAMCYAVDIYTTGTLNVNGASLHSNYIAVRCFFGDSVVNVNSGSITSSRNNYGIWCQSAPGAKITIAEGVSYTHDSNNDIYIFG